MKSAHKDYRVYLNDIRAAVLRIEQYASGGRELFLKDIKTQDAIILQLSIIGEAASKLPAGMKENVSDIPWKKIIGLRNIIVHEYSQLNIVRIWETAEKDLPVLKRTVEGMLRVKAA